MSSPKSLRQICLDALPQILKDEVIGKLENTRFILSINNVHELTYLQTSTGNFLKYEDSLYKDTNSIRIALARFLASNLNLNQAHTKLINVLNVAQRTDRFGKDLHISVNIPQWTTSVDFENMCQTFKSYIDLGCDCI